MIAAVDIVTPSDPARPNPAAGSDVAESGFGALFASLEDAHQADAVAPDPEETPADDGPTLVLDLIALLTGVPAVSPAPTVSDGSVKVVGNGAATGPDADASIPIPPTVVGDQFAGSTALPVAATSRELTPGEKLTVLKPPSNRHSSEGRNPAALKIPTPEPATQLSSGLRRNDEVAEGRSALVPPAPLAGSAPAVSTRTEAQTLIALATLPTPALSPDRLSIAAAPMPADATTLVGALPAAATLTAAPATPAVPALPVIVTAASVVSMHAATPPTRSSRVAAADAVKSELSPTAGVTSAPAQFSTPIPVFAGPTTSPALATPTAPAAVPAPPFALAPIPEPTPRLAATVTDGSFDVATDRLGAVSVRLDAGDARLSVQFTVDRSASAALLDAQGDRLEAAVAAQGARLDALSVDVRGGGERRPPPPAAPTAPVILPRSTPTAAARPRDRFA